MFKKIIVFSLIPILIILSSISIKQKNKSETLHENMTNEEISLNNQVSCSESSAYNKINIDNSELSFDSVFKTFVYSSSVEIDHVTGNGSVQLNDFSFSEDNSISVELTNFSQCSEIVLSFYSNSELVGKNSLYFAQSEYGVYFSSSISLDTARRNAGHILNYDLVFDNEENENIQLLDQQRGIGVKGSVSGIIKWADEQGYVHFAKNAKIRVSIAGSYWSGYASTDEFGYYNVRYDDI